LSGSQEQAKSTHSSAAAGLPSAHIGFDVKDHPAFLQTLAANGIKLDEPARTSPTTGNIVTYVTDPWGTRIEIIQRAPLKP
jgi:catechol 2,3-dioxygenase-like lactoylglutathione lyase family enzyme